MPVGHRPLNISNEVIGGKLGKRSVAYSKSKISTNWTLLSALKKVFPCGRSNRCTFAITFDEIFNFCICFKAEEQKMRHCAYMICFYASLLWGRVVSFGPQKVIQDGGHQGQLLYLGGQ